MATGRWALWAVATGVRLCGLLVSGSRGCNCWVLWAVAVECFGSGCQALWEVLWAVATGVFVLWEND